MSEEPKSLFRQWCGNSYEWDALTDIEQQRWSRLSKKQTATLAAKDAEIARLREKTSMTMGVGDGSGRLFVHGDYASIKAAQAIVIENTALRQQLAASEAEKAELREARSRWRMRFDSAMDQWQSERKDLTAQLEEAKRMRPTHGDIKLLEQKLADAEKARDAVTKRNGELTSQVEAMQKHIDELNNQILEPSTPPAP